MSEYQYYEFQALDRPLDDKARAALRQISSRAKITATSMINEYHFGDFKGDPAKLVEKYFDAFLYFASFGTRTVMFRMPIAGLSRADAEPYSIGDENFLVREADQHLVLAYESDDQGDSERYNEEGDDDSLTSILAVRDELLRDDRRPLYLGWLLAAQQSYNDDAEDLLEPPVPPGLQSLSVAQQALGTFLGIDPNLITAAAEGSPGETSALLRRSFADLQARAEVCAKEQQKLRKGKKR